jgi:regulator of nucleoside diphosphate kinase
MQPFAPPPPIILHSQDYNSLVVLASIAGRQAYAPFLRAELRRAELRAIESMPPGIATMGARVTYRIGSMVRVRTLVFPSAVCRVEGALSIATPEGTALLGLRAGDRMPYLAEDGQSCQVAMLHVEEPREHSENAVQALDRRLDHALEETFPASDPVSVICTARER